MRCRSAERAALERELGPLDAAAEAALQRHLDGCAACASRVRDERILLRDLAALGDAAAPPLDVTARVMGSLPRLGPTDRDEVSTRQLGWAAAAAMLGGALIVWTSPEMLARLGDLGHLITRVGGSLLGFADALAAPFAALFWTLVRLLEAVAATLDGLQPVALRAEPFARGVLFAAYAAMASVILIVLTRDLRRPLGGLAREVR